MNRERIHYSFSLRHCEERSKPEIENIISYLFLIPKRIIQLSQRE
jgi:hypothetical protein